MKRLYDFIEYIEELDRELSEHEKWDEEQHNQIRRELNFALDSLAKKKLPIEETEADVKTEIDYKATNGETPKV